MSEEFHSDTEPINIIRIEELRWIRVVKQLSTTITR